MRRDSDDVAIVRLSRIYKDMKNVFTKAMSLGVPLCAITVQMALAYSGKSRVP